MAKKQRKYNMEYKIQAVKLAKEIGGAKAAAELGIPENTMYAWTKAAREERLDIGSGSHTPQTATSMIEYAGAFSGVGWREDAEFFREYWLW